MEDTQAPKPQNLHHHQNHQACPPASNPHAFQPPSHRHCIQLTSTSYLHHRRGPPSLVHLAELLSHRSANHRGCAAQIVHAHLRSLYIQSRVSWVATDFCRRRTVDQRLIMAADVQRPAAMDQITQPATQPVYNFSFSDFLRREYRFGLDPNRPYCKEIGRASCRERVSVKV